MWQRIKLLIDYRNKLDQNLDNILLVYTELMKTLNAAIATNGIYHL